MALVDAGTTLSGRSLVERVCVSVSEGTPRCEVAGSVRYVGSASTIADPKRDVPARLKQYLTRSKTGATFYRKWLTVTHPYAPRDDAHLLDQHADFLAQFGQWDIAALTIPDHGAVELVPELEHALIHVLRPEYNGHSEDPGRVPAALSANAT